MDPTEKCLVICVFMVVVVETRGPTNTTEIDITPIEPASTEIAGKEE